MESPQKQFNDNFFIAGIGASAGGLEAITEFFDNVNPDIKCAFVIVQHLSPDYKSLMPELLGTHTKLPIYVAEDDMMVRPGKIYLIPHKKTMTIRFGKLQLKDKEKLHTSNMTIDIFLSSLAEFKKEKAIGIILSGTGTDGTKGMQNIKKNGGLVMVQDPLSAKFDGMPNSAINTGLPDFVLAPEMMPEEILNHLEETPAERSTLLQISEEDETVLNEILGLIKTSTGNDFSLYKRPTLNRRISRRMIFKDIDNLSEYRDLLVENREEVISLSKEFLIGVTKFFRDTQAFDILAKKVIPEIVNSKEDGDVLKVWVAGCSTGEEAYTIAILLFEYLKFIGKQIEIKVFATDIDKEAIEKAGKGVYSEKSLSEISSERLQKYFERTGSDFTVLPFIRKMVIFAQHDLIKDAPFSKIDLVSCRNLLIYFNQQLQKKAFSRFHFSLNFGGYLFLGSSENLGEYATVFTEINKKWKIYKCNKEFQVGKSENFNSLNSTFKIGQDKPVKSLQQTDAGNYGDLFLNGLIEIAGYAAIFVNENFEIVHAMGDFRKYLHLPEKTLDFNLLKMVPDDLSVILGSTIRKCFKNNEKVFMNACRISDANKKMIVDLAIQSVRDHKKNRLAIIYLKEASVSYTEKDLIKDADSIPDNFQEQQLTYLKQELAETKENLQSLVEELETANEEMQSSNEELTSANEELQSTNEELQSLNEELHTVNSEHQQKIKELIELNDDLNNYFSSTDIGQVFVDNNLFIRKFTPAVKRHINLIENDIGRPISHLSNNIRYEGLLEDLKRVILNGETIETEIQTVNGKWYLMKALPYIRHDLTTHGAILAFIDISNLKEVNDHFSGILNSSLNGMATYTPVFEEGKVLDFACTLANPALEKIFRKSRHELIGETLMQHIPDARESGLLDKFISIVQSGVPIHIEQKIMRNSEEIWLEISAVKISSGIAVTVGDISEKRLSQEKMREAFLELKAMKDNLQKLNNELETRVLDRTKELSISEERFRILSLATNDAIWDWNFLTNKVWWSEGFKKLFGYGLEGGEFGISSLFDKVHPDDKDRVISGIQDVISSGKKSWSGEYRFLKSDGTYAFVLDRAYVLQYKENQMPYRMLGSMIDLSNLKKTQMQLELTNQNLLKINTDLDNFIYTASHDLKSPISNIEGLMYTMEDVLKEHDLFEDNAIKDIIDMIHLSVNRFKSTIQDLTEIAKVQKENMEDLEKVNIKNLVEEIIFSVKSLFDKSNTVINYKLNETAVVFSRRNMRSIMYNLISNAIKYKHPERDPVITIESEKIDNYTMISIADNGLGIPMDKQNKVFGMFKRMHSHVDGTGIGLYIVKRALENAGGKISLESEVGKGSVFKLYFPDNLIK